MKYLKRKLIMIAKMFTNKKDGMYSVCKSHVFRRNQYKNRPEKAILSVAKFKRMESSFDRDEEKN